MSLLRKTTILLFSIFTFSAAFASTEMPKDGDNLYEVKSFFTMAGEQMLNNAKKYIGRPYRRGSIGPKAFDCSGFTKYIFNTMEITLNRTSRSQFLQGKPVSRDNLRVGDLVFFGSAHSGSGVGHVGIVYSVESDGSFKFIHASCHSGVTVSSIKESYYAKKYRGARRVLPY